MQPVVIAVIVVFWLLLSVKVLNEYERAVIFRLGKLLPDAKGPGLTLVAWPIDRIDPIPNKQGSPGIFADAQFGVYFDNLKVTPNQ